MHFIECVSILIKISLKFVPKGPINNITALVQIMAWRRPGDKPLSEPMMVNLPTHICVTRPQWVKAVWWRQSKGKWLIKEGCCDTIHWQYMGLINWHHTHIYISIALTHHPLDKMAAISQIFSNVFSWMKLLQDGLKFHLSLFLMVQLTIYQYWLAPSYYLNQWWLDFQCIYASLGLNELKTAHCIHQQCDCLFISLLMLATKKLSPKLPINGWGIHP